MRIFVNETPCSIPEDATVADGVRAFNPDAISILEAGSGYVTDGVGRKVALDDPLTGGAILRIIGPAGRPDDGESG